MNYNIGAKKGAIGLSSVAEKIATISVCAIE